MKANNFTQIAKEAIYQAKEISKKYFYDSKVISSLDKDVKTLADIEMNKVIIDKLNSTNIPIISEEESNQFLPEKGYYWIVDPIDGTLNFSRGFGCYSISISLWKDELPHISIVYDLYQNRLFISEKNQGSRLNDNSIQVSSLKFIKDAILATGFPSGANYQYEALLPIVGNIIKFKKVRAIGSASLMLAYVASGVFDVYYEKDIYLWDVAAGLGLVSEAGGCFELKRTGNFKYEVLASNKYLFSECKNMLMKKI